MSKDKSIKTPWFFKFLESIEKVGNKLPHPITLFALFSLAVIIISGICSALGVSATGEILNTTTNIVEVQTITVRSMFNGAGIVYILTNAISNFTEFAPLGVVLVAMLGVGVAEDSGYIATIMRRTVAVTPRRLITPVIVFLGVISNIASDAGYVVLVPLGAMVFLACGRHPLAGLAAAFSGVSGGFSANLLIGTTDPLLAGISTEAARLIEPNYIVEATANYYFMAVSTFLITILGTIVTDKIVEPRLGKYTPNGEVVEEIAHVSLQEKNALKLANLTFFAMVAVLVILLIPQNSFLRNAETGSIVSKSPLMAGIVVIITLFFFVPSVVFGFVSKKYKNDKQVAKALGNSMASMGGYIALAFAAAQFVNYFNYTNLGRIIALKGAEVLEASGLSGPVLMIMFVFLAAFINLFMGSASAKWAIMAPVFIPMFMSVGYSPELVQIAYRIGDSTTNLITPLMSYFAMIVVFAQKYNEDSGIGTIISTMLPYSLVYLIGWCIMLAAWMMLGLPLGVDAPLYL